MLRFFGQFFVKSEAKLDVLRMHIQPRERLQNTCFLNQLPVIIPNEPYLLRNLTFPLGYA